MERDRAEQETKYENLDNTYNATAFLLKRSRDAYSQLEHDIADRLKGQTELFDQR